MNRLRGARRDAGATDPILVIAAIAVSLILLVGGSFAVAALINSSRDLNARSDLDKVAVAETAAAATRSGAYMTWAITSDGTTSGATDSTGADLAHQGLGFTTSDGTTVKVAANADGWVAGAQSLTGTTFWRSSRAAAIYTGSISPTAYASSLRLPSFGPAYNAVADCPRTQYNGSINGAANHNDTFASRTVTAVDANKVSVTFTGTGSSFCEWAVNPHLNLGGDSYSSDDARTLVVWKNGGASNNWLDVTRLDMTLDALNGYTLDDDRTMTVTMTLADPSARDAAITNMNSTGFQFSFTLPGQSSPVLYRLSLY
ncbi:hypothetical protein ACWGJ9_09720 [Curtobacterium citreum]